MCGRTFYFVGQYYPVCPQPNLTFGAAEHIDTSFMTVVLQRQLDGLQGLHENQWVNVIPISRALVFNMGDILQASSYTPFDSVCEYPVHVFP